MRTRWAMIVLLAGLGTLMLTIPGDYSCCDRRWCHGWPLEFLTHDADPSTLSGTLIEPWEIWLRIQSIQPLTLLADLIAVFAGLAAAIWISIAVVTRNSHGRQFTVRLLLVSQAGIALVSAAMAWRLSDGRRQMKVAEQLSEQVAAISFEYEELRPAWLWRVAKRLGCPVPQVPWAIAATKCVMDIDVSGKLGTLYSIQSLAIEDVEISDESFAQFRSFTQLHSLYVNNCAISDHSFPTITCFSQLNWLTLWSTRITDEGASAYLATSPRLNYVCLEDSAVGTKTVLAIARLPTIRSVSLGGTQVAGEDVRLLATCDLTELWLDRLPVTDSDISFVGKLTKLECLGLSQTHIGDQTIEQLLHLPELRTLAVENTNVTEQGVLACVAIKHLKTLWASPEAATPHACQTLNAAFGRIVVMPEL